MSTSAALECNQIGYIKASNNETPLIRIFVCIYLDRPHFNKSASSNALVKSWIGQVTTIKCAVYANPLANITWFKDGRAILDGVTSTHDVSTLTLTPKTVDDFGLYSCNATNSKGTAWYHITLEQLRK